MDSKETRQHQLEDPREYRKLVDMIAQMIHEGREAEVLAQIELPEEYQAYTDALQELSNHNAMGEDTPAQNTTTPQTDATLQAKPTTPHINKGLVVLGVALVAGVMVMGE